MVQKYKSQIWVYKYPFELVMAAYERRFPSCELLPVFVGSDILREEISPDKSIHIVERRCKINVDAPFILKKLAGVDYVYFIQVNTLDRLARTLKIEATNESFANRITIKEYCTYYVCIMYPLLPPSMFCLRTSLNFLWGANHISRLRSIDRLPLYPFT